MSYGNSKDSRAAGCSGTVLLVLVLAVFVVSFLLFVVGWH